MCKFMPLIKLNINYKKMKKLIAIILVLLASNIMNAQIETPAPSPFSKIEQKVGLTDVTIEYSRPGVKGRAIFGNLVPFGKIWRTGANQRTKITFSDDITIDGKTLKAGTYAIFTKPEASSWDVYFYTEYQGGGAPQEWDDSKVALSTRVAVEPIPFNVESFSIDFNNLRNDSASIDIIWEKTYVTIPFSVPTESKVLASIKGTMNGPSAQDFYASAVYYLESGNDINQAVSWIDKAIEMTKEQPRFWYLRQQSLIHAKAGNKAGAIAAAKQSLALAIEAKNDDYIKLNKDSLAEWEK